MVASKRVLLVDGESKILEVLETYFADEGFVVRKAYDGSSAFERIKHEQPDVIILDLRLRNTSGLDVFHAVRALRGDR